ncbi:MAG: acyl carrier protein [Bacillota bacterium]|nr:acyl carrier protein [Bacillota bacterium]
MKDEQVFAKIRDILVEQLGVEADEVTLDSDFTDELNADSLDIVELIMAMEQEFGISIPDEDAERIRTVGDAVDFVKNNT